MEGCGDLLFGRGVGKEVAGELLDRKLIKGLIFVIGVNDPITISPDGAQRVGAITGRVGIAGQIEPDARPALAIRGVGEHLVDRFFIGIGRGIRSEVVDLLERRRKAAKVKAGAAEQGEAVGLAGGFQARLREAMRHPMIDPIAGPSLVGDFRQGAILRLNERPMFGIARPFVDPAGDQGDLGGLEPFPFLGRRHPGGLIGLVQPRNKLALRRLPRNDRDRPARKLANGLAANVKPQLATPVGFVKAMTSKAVLREDRTDLAVEVDGGL